MLLLATDLDGTLVGNRPALDALNRRLLAGRGDVFLVYLTGRHFGSALDLIRRENLLTPDCLVTDVGTRVHFLAENGSWTEDRGFRDRQSWPREEAALVLRRASGLVPQDLGGYLPPLRLSYSSANPVAAAREALGLLGRAAIAARVVTTGGGTVDVLPPGAGKAAALQWVIDSTGISPSFTLVCGDSGNDWELFQMGWPGVIVGNAEETLKRIQRPQAYHAEGRAAAGILEAIAHFGIPL